MADVETESHVPGGYGPISVVNTGALAALNMVR